jgi:hypothetical protein
MIITEIKIKHLKVRISEFEDLVFDKNILPIFTTPSILREVDTKKLSKYKIETLNPQKKLTFKIVSFNEIVEELANKINKIANDLEPFYFYDPSDFNSLNSKVKENLTHIKFIEDKININNAKFRIKKSTVKKKFLILYGLKFATKYKNLKNINRYNKYKFNNKKFIIKSNISNIAEKNFIKNFTLKKFKPLFLFNLKNFFNYRFLNLEYINLFNKNNYINNLILFSGLIPTSKGALMLLEDNGWDLDLLSNRNHISQRIKKLRPYKLRSLRRLRRLRRLRLINTNLFLYRSINVEKITKNQVNQGRNLSILNLTNQTNSVTETYITQTNKLDFNNFNSLTRVQEKHSLSSIIKSRINEKRKIKINNLKLLLIKHFLYSIFRLQINEKFKKFLLGLVTPGKINSRVKNKNLLSNKQILYYIFKLCKKIKQNNINIVNNYRLELDLAASAYATLLLKSNLAQNLKKSSSISEINISTVPHNENKAEINNLKFLKHSDNKLKFIINWIGKNLNLHTNDYSDLYNNNINSEKLILQQINYKGNPIFSHKVDVNRLDLNNIYDLFLIIKNKPIEIPLIEDIEIKDTTQKLLIDEKQAKLNQISLFNSNKAKGIVKADRKRILWFKRRKYNKIKNKLKQRKKNFNKKNRNWQSFMFSNSRRKFSTLLTSRNFMTVTQLGVGINSLSTLRNDFNNLNRAISTLNNNNSIKNKKFKKNQIQKIEDNTAKNIFDKISIDILNLHLKSIKYKVKNWTKKKKLSKNLLHKTSLRFIKATNANFLNQDTISKTKTSKPKIAIKNIIRNRNKKVNKLRRPIISKKLKLKIKFLANIKKMENKLKLKSNPLYSRYLNNLKLSNNFSAWNFISSLLIPASKSNTVLFWAVIKLYSSSFNPMLSLNNNYYSLTNFLNKSSSQIKIFKNKEDNLNSINSITNVNSSVESNLDTEKINKNFNNKSLIISKIVNSEILSKNINFETIKMISKNKKKARLPKRSSFKLDSSNNLSLIKFFNSLNFNLFDPLNKKIITKLLQPFFINNDSRTLTKFTSSNILTHLDKLTLNINNNKFLPILNKNKNTFKLNIINDYKQNFLNIRKADNKRFLFLYFILPIFFNTLRNKNSFSVSAPLNKNNRVQVNNLPKFDANNQLQALIKLILISGSTLNFNKRPISKLITKSHKFTKYNNLTSLIAYKSNYRNLLLINNKQINNYKKNNKFINSKFNNLYSEMGQRSTLNKLSHIKVPINLFKWIILFMVQSLAPLKRKNNFHSLIFFKILKAKKLLNTSKYIMNYPLIKNYYNKDNTNLIDFNNSTIGNNFESNNKVISPTVIINSKLNNIVNEASDLKDNKQNRLVTYFPGGRLIRDWKRINSAIWQEEYKFNLYYRREKISLNLSNKNTNKKISILFAIISIFKLWDTIKISSLKSITSLKLQALFINKNNIYKNPEMELVISFLNIFFDKLKYYIIDFIFNNLDRFKKIKSINSRFFYYKSFWHWYWLIINKKININKNKKNKKNKIIYKKMSFYKRKHKIKQFTNKIINSYYKNINNILIDYILLFFNYNNDFNNFNIKKTKIKLFVYHNNISKDNFNMKFNLIINQIKNILPVFYSYKFVSALKDLHPFRKTYPKLHKFKFQNRISTQQNKISIVKINFLNYLNYYYTGKILDLSLINPLWNKFAGWHGVNQVLKRVTPDNNNNKVNNLSIINVTNKFNHIDNIIKKQGTVSDHFIHNLEIKNSFNNLVNAKSIVIGKIRSIKLLELIDQLKIELDIAEKLAALIRVADITDLNLNNKKKSRKINSFKYLNKKNIIKSNRIKILHAIKSIKNDFRFEQNLDSNSLSNLPISLLYYSNLKPLAINKNLYKFNNKIKNTERVYDNKLEPVLSSYLRELSIYNRETKGIMNYYSKIVGYNFNYNTNKISSSVFEFLSAAFISMRCLISKPIFIITPDKISIHLFYFLMVANKKTLKKIFNKLRPRRGNFKQRYRNNILLRINNTYNRNRLKVAKKFYLKSLNEIFPKRLNLLCISLNKIFNKPVELNLTRLHYPSADSNILVNIMGILINKVKLPKILKNLFAGSIIKTLIKIKSRKYNDISIIPAFLTGLSIKVAGRIMTQNMRPRFTINYKRRGASASGKINYLNFARLTNKNKRGSYSITISAGQNYFK